MKVRTRRSIRRFLVARLDPPVDGLALALGLGDRSRLLPSTREVFARSGTAHLLAISGLHVGIVALVVAWLITALVARLPWLRVRLAPRMAGALGALLAAMLYGSLTGWAVSTRRAAAMTCAVLLALLARRRPDPLQICAAAWCGLMLGDPASLWQPATQLSFGSVVALVRLAPLQRDRVGRTLAGATAAATVGTAPLQLGLFGHLPLLGVAANLLAIPVLGSALVPLLLGSSLLGIAWPTAGTALLAVADSIARSGCCALEIAAAGPQVTASPPPGLVAIAMTAIAASLCLPGRRARWTGALLGACLALLPVHPGAPPRGELCLTTLDVGHGDALLLSTPRGRQLLVDGGGAYRGVDPGERIVVPALRRLGVEHLDAVLITHLHIDHYGGVTAVLDALDVDLLLLGEPPPPDHPVMYAVEAAIAHAVPVRILPHALPASSGGTNDRSVVLRVPHGRRAFLLTGDIELAGEQRLLASGQPLAADVLKVPHHGSDTLSTDRFLRTVDPVLAVASLDVRSRHHLPRPSVTRRYRDHGIGWLSTARDGTIQVSTDGDRLRHRTFRLPCGWSPWRPAGDPHNAQAIDSRHTAAYSGSGRGFPVNDTKAAKRILVVDDEPDIRLSLTTLLEAHGYETEEAEDGQAALDKLNSADYDLMVLDMMMPNVDGYGVLEQMAPRTRADMPIIVLTAKNQDDDILKGYNLGATYYVTKPYENATVLNIARYLIGDLTAEQRRNLERHL